MEFPTIHTNIWDTVIAIPSIIAATQVCKLLPIPRTFYPTIASIFGFALSILVSHRTNIWAALFMGGYYSGAAIGTYSSLKTSWRAFKKRRQKKKAKKEQKKPESHQSDPGLIHASSPVDSSENTCCFMNMNFSISSEGSGLEYKKP